MFNTEVETYLPLGAVLFFGFIFKGRIVYIGFHPSLIQGPGWPWIHYVPEDCLKLLALAAPSPKSCRHQLTCHHRPHIGPTAIWEAIDELLLRESVFSRDKPPDRLSSHTWLALKMYPNKQRLDRLSRVHTQTYMCVCICTTIYIYNKRGQFGREWEAHGAVEGRGRGGNYVNTVLMYEILKKTRCLGQWGSSVGKRHLSPGDLSSVPGPLLHQLLEVVP